MKTLSISQIRDEPDWSIHAYTHYIAATRGISLDEAARRSLSRAWQMAHKGRRMAILTAFRGGSDDPIILADNRNRNRGLAADLRAMDYGYTPVLGHYVETKDGKEVEVDEESFIVSGDTNDTSFQRSILGLLRQYNQEAAVVKPSSTDVASLLSQDGTITPLGAWNPANLHRYYTRMRWGVVDRKFVFEAVGNECGSARYAIYIWKKGLGAPKAAEIIDSLTEAH